MDCSPPGSSVHGDSPWGFSRQEHWSGLPCPPPGDLPNPGTNLSLPHCRQILYHMTHQGSPNSLLKWNESLSVRLFVTPWTIQSTEFSRPEYWSEQPLPSPGDLPNPGIEPRSPALPVDSLPGELWRKPKNTGVGSLSLLQVIFPTQESNWGFLHCRWILYQLSYEGSPTVS